MDDYGDFSYIRYISIFKTDSLRIWAYIKQIHKYFFGGDQYDF